jgi:hypothetical protein
MMPEPFSQDDDLDNFISNNRGKPQLSEISY